jgi:hypothetical protein
MPVHVCKNIPFRICMYVISSAHIPPHISPLRQARVLRPADGEAGKAELRHEVSVCGRVVAWRVVVSSVWWRWASSI